MNETEREKLVDKLDQSFGLSRGRIQMIVEEVEAEIKCNEIAVKNNKESD